MNIGSASSVVAFLLLLGTSAGAETAGVSQSAAPVDEAVVASSPSATATPSEDGPVVPALTPVSVELLATLGSKISKSGDRFPIRLAAPIAVAGREVVPAGIAGEGEVVHAKSSGGMGAAGELVLAARYVDWNGRRLKLRSLRLAANGDSRVDTVNTINVASAASPLPVGLVGFFISGGQVTVAQGTIAQAKTAEDFFSPELAVAGETAVAPPAAASSQLQSTGE